MEPLPNLEACLRLAYEASDAQHASGVSLASYFARAKTRGRRRSGLAADLLFPDALRAKLGARVIAQAMDEKSFRACARARPAVPIATREWLSEAALALGKAEGPALMWALLRTMSELEGAAQKLLGARASRAMVRQVLHGVGPRTLRAEPFAALLVRVLKIAQAVYIAFREAGFAHPEAWRAVEDRLWAPHPTGRDGSSGAYLPSLVQAASGNARRKLRREAESGRTREHAQALLARFVSGEGARLWPWRDAAGGLVPLGNASLSPEAAGACFFVLLTHAAFERRARGGPAGGLSPPFAEAGFASGEWLPDRSDDLAVRLLAAGDAPVQPEMLEVLPALLRATLAPRNGVPASLDLPAEEARAMLDSARQRLPGLLRWLEENGRELLETT
jgi:hypothetical protein